MNRLPLFVGEIRNATRTQLKILVRNLIKQEGNHNALTCQLNGAIQRKREQGGNVLTRIWRNEPVNWFRIVLNNSRKSQCHSKTAFIKAHLSLRSIQSIQYELTVHDGLNNFFLIFIFVWLGHI